MSVIVETSIGDITVDLFTDERPRCCLNFLKLCKMKYYNFSLFHTVQKNLVAQAGDPTATGRGGESIFGILYGEQARFFEMEVSPRILHNKKGLMSMVNNGSDMHGSQFFITLTDSVDYLNNKHTVFGEVAEGMDIVDKLNETFCDEGNRPHQDIRIYHTVILDDPFEDPGGLVLPSTSPRPTQEMLDSDRIPCDADILDEDGMSAEQLAEMRAEQEAKANTQILEMVGDIPDEDVAPPETVLFVCKLNPVTTSDDLEIIFSRFGDIKSCEVIKDQKSGESLQYAFVEFEKEADCEMAYFKMDNVLIDDRRIHVDFSQSVSKIKWKGKGKGVETFEDGDAPKYILKDRRKKDGYDLVYMHDDIGDVETTKEKSHKKHKSSRESPVSNKKRSRERERKTRESSRERYESKSHQAQKSHNRDDRRDRGLERRERERWDRNDGRERSKERDSDRKGRDRENNRYNNKERSRERGGFDKREREKSNSNRDRNYRAEQNRDKDFSRRERDRGGREKSTERNTNNKETRKRRDDSRDRGYVKERSQSDKRKDKYFDDDNSRYSPKRDGGNSKRNTKKSLSESDEESYQPKAAHKTSERKRNDSESDDSVQDTRSKGDKKKKSKHKSKKTKSKSSSEDESIKSDSDSSPERKHKKKKKNKR